MRRSTVDLVVVCLFVVWFGVIFFLFLFFESRSHYVTPTGLECVEICLLFPPSTGIQGAPHHPWPNEGYLQKQEQLIRGNIAQERLSLPQQLLTVYASQEGVGLCDNPSLSRQGLLPYLRLALKWKLFSNSQSARFWKYRCEPPHLVLIGLWFKQLENRI